MSEPTISLTEQLKCARRELALRRRVYHKWTVNGQMPENQARHEIACMAAICATLEGLVRKEGPQLALIGEE